VLAFCRAELLQQNYLHAVLPQVRFNALATEWERSEQTGIATLMKGLFNTFRNPAAHAPRVAWATSQRRSGHAHPRVHAAPAPRQSRR